jgi:hypothetical protein
MVEIAVIAEEWNWAATAAHEAEIAVSALGAVPVLPAMLCRLRGRVLEATQRVGDAREQYVRAIELSATDGFEYETVLASIGLARVERDDAGIERAYARLRELDVVSLPPGT